MAFLQAVFAFLMGLFKSLPILDRWFTKSPTQKVIDRQAGTDKEIDKAKKTGRPTWEK